MAFPSNVKVNIIDRTGVAGMTPRAQAILEAAAASAAKLGITLEITAAKGGGHKSHGSGTEWDLKGYKDGKLWTPEQRVAVADGARAGGADRFGLYSFGKGFTGNGSLHVGYSGRGRPASTWGYRGRTGGAASRLFQNPAEKAFLQGKSPRYEDVPDPFGIDQMQASRMALADEPRPTSASLAASDLAMPKPAGTEAGLSGTPDARQPVPGRTLRKGMRGDDVRAMQERLIQRGAVIEPDADFGRRTGAALRDYQRAHGLTPDAIAGPRTRASLFDPGVRDLSAPTAATEGGAGVGVPPITPAAPSPPRDMFSDDIFGPRPPSLGEFGRRFDPGSGAGVDGSSGANFDQVIRPSFGHMDDLFNPQRSDSRVPINPGRFSDAFGGGAALPYAPEESGWRFDNYNPIEGTTAGERSLMTPSPVGEPPLAGVVRDMPGGPPVPGPVGSPVGAVSGQAGISLPPVSPAPGPAPLPRPKPIVNPEPAKANPLLNILTMGRPLLRTALGQPSLFNGFKGGGSDSNRMAGFHPFGNAYLALHPDATEVPEGYAFGQPLRNLFNLFNPEPDKKK